MAKPHSRILATSCELAIVEFILEPETIEKVHKGSERSFRAQATIQCSLPECPLNHLSFSGQSENEGKLGKSVKRDALECVNRRCPFPHQ